MINILLVDDEPLVLASLLRVLKTDGWNLVCASNAAAAEDAIRLGSYDLVISDQNMPGKKGTDFLRDLRAESATIRLILMTAMPSAVGPCSTQDLALSALVVKPWDCADLISTVHTVLKEPIGDAAAPAK